MVRRTDIDKGFPLPDRKKYVQIPPQAWWIDYETSIQTGMPEGLYVYVRNRDYWQLVDPDYGATMTFPKRPSQGYELDLTVHARQEYAKAMGVSMHETRKTA